MTISHGASNSPNDLNSGVNSPNDIRRHGKPPSVYANFIKMANSAHDDMIDRELANLIFFARPFMKSAFFSRSALIIALCRFPVIPFFIKRIRLRSTAIYPRKCGDFEAIKITGKPVSIMDAQHDTGSVRSWLDLRYQDIARDTNHRSNSSRSRQYIRKMVGIQARHLVRC